MNDKTNRKILLGNYLAAKGPVKALTCAECQIFGIPYPLQSGWAQDYCSLEITPTMIRAVEESINGKNNAPSNRIRAGLGVLASGLVERENLVRTNAHATSNGSETIHLLDSHASAPADQLPPWESERRCNGSTVDYLRRLLARCERGEVIDVTVIEHLSGGQRVQPQPVQERNGFASSRYSITYSA